MSSKYGITVLLVYVGLFAGRMALAPHPTADARDPASFTKTATLITSDQRSHNKAAD